MASSRRIAATGQMAASFTELRYRLTAVLAMDRLGAEVLAGWTEDTGRTRHP